MQKKNGFVFLGVNGTLSSAIIKQVRERYGSEVDLLGFDVQPSCDLALDSYQLCDLASRSSIRAAVGAICYGDYADLRLLICSAVMGLPTLEGGEFDEEAFYQGMQINLIGQGHFAVDFTKRALAADAKVRLVAVGSTAAYVGSADIAYSMSKAGLDGLVRSLSKYGAQRRVTAMAVHTGIFRSNMEASVSDERKAKTIAATHVKRVATLDEITNFVSYYLLDAPDFATGMCVDINGGQHT